MPQALMCGYVLPYGAILERWRIADEHASAFIEWTKRNPKPTVEQFRLWMINHRGVPVGYPC